MMNKKAVIYARVSTNRQAKDELPIESQVESCRQKAMELGLNVDKTFLDEGFTASNDRRPAFKNAIDYCEAFDVGYFVTWSSSRFARNKRDASYYKDRLDTAGTKIVYVSMDIDISTTSGWMIDGFMELADEYYSRQTSDDTRRSMIQNAKSGFWNGGHPPYGYKPIPSPINPKRKSLIPVEEEAEILRMIFEMKATRGIGARSIMKTLNHDGLTNRGKEWKLSTIRDILKNRAAIGQTVFGKTARGKKRSRRPQEEWIIVDSHPAIIEPELFFRVQKLLETETPICVKDNTHHLLVGMMTCADCKARMHIESATGRSRKYYYYYCRAAKLSDAHDLKRYRADEIDLALVQAVKDQVLKTQVLKKISKKVSEIKSDWENEVLHKTDKIKKEIKALEKKNKNLLDVIQTLGVSAPNISELTNCLQKNTADINAKALVIRELENSGIDQLDIDIDIKELNQILVGILDQEDDLPSVRNFLQSFIKKIEITPEEMKVNYEPLNLFNIAVRNPSGWLPGSQVVGTRRIIVSLPSSKRGKPRVA